MRSACPWALQSTCRGTVDVPSRTEVRAQVMGGASAALLNLGLLPLQLVFAPPSES